MNKLQVVGWVVVAVILIDVIGWLSWAMSGQMPTDGFYLGRGTSEIINLIK